MKLLSLSQIWRWDPHEDLCYSFSSFFSALINIFLDLPISASLLLLLSLFLPFLYSIQFLHWVSLLFSFSFEFWTYYLVSCVLSYHVCKFFSYVTFYTYSIQLCCSVLFLKCKWSLCLVSSISLIFSLMTYLENRNPHIKLNLFNVYLNTTLYTQ